MPCRQSIGTEIAGSLEQIGEFDLLVAGDARNRCFAGNIAIGEAIDHTLPKAALIIQHVMGNTQPLRDPPRILNVLPGAAGSLAMGRGAIIVKLQSDADHVISLAAEQRGHNRGIDATRHRHDHPRLGSAAWRDPAN